MKKMIFALAFMMATTMCVEGHNYYNRNSTISVQTFYDELLPYGEWINTPDYGYAWRPYFDSQEDFRPYSTGGNWVYTDLGWTWVSDYRWGWAAFHYGRWFFDDYLGWMWIPGNEWAPAWVTWGSYNDMWAWAPMGPAIQVNINVNWYAPRFWWTFVPRQHFCARNWHEYVWDRPVRVANITCITNVYYDTHRHHNSGWFHGPGVRDVEKYTNRHIRTMQLTDSDRPDNRVVRNNRVNVYRPEVTTSRDKVQPGRYRAAGTLRTNEKIQRATGDIMKRTGLTGTEKRTVNQTTGATRTGSGQMNRSEPKREIVTRSSVRKGNDSQRTGESVPVRSASNQKSRNN